MACDSAKIGQYSGNGDDDGADWDGGDEVPEAIPKEPEKSPKKHVWSTPNDHVKRPKMGHLGPHPPRLPSVAIKNSS